MTSPRYASVVLDVDSTLCGIEGVDWLAARRSSTLAAEIVRLTAGAMAGEMDLQAIYATRMDRIRPDADDLAALAAAYRESVATSAADVLRQLRAAGVQLHLVSGGLRQAILPVSRDLGFDQSELHAVAVVLDDAGRYQDFDRHSPLCTTGGKCQVVSALCLPAPILAIGDGISDAALRDVADAFVAYTGYVRREAVVRLATRECGAFDDILNLVLP